MKNLTSETIVEHIFTTPNPETGSQPPAHFAWILFENDTIYLSFPNELTPLEASFDELANVAKEELQKLGSAMAGSPSGDFNVNKVSWYPDDFVFMITYDHGHIFNFGIYEEETSDLTVGLVGRAARSEDAETLKIKKIRNFQGEVKSLEA